MSSVQSDDDYDVISNPSNRSIDSSIADLDQPRGPTEPPPLQTAIDRFDTVSLSADDIQSYVRRVLDGSSNVGTIKARNISTYLQNRTVRVYVDGVFDGLGMRQVLQLRQAKLSFASVYLIVGVFADDLCQIHNTSVSFPHVERCEIVRHCRWVDEVLPDAPWQLDDKYLHRHRIDYVGLEEGSSVDPLCDKVRLKGYDEMKRLGKVVPLRRTIGATNTVPLTPLPISVPLPSVPPVASQASPPPQHAPSPPPSKTIDVIDEDSVADAISDATNDHPTSISDPFSGLAI